MSVIQVKKETGPGFTAASQQSGLNTRTEASTLAKLVEFSKLLADAESTSSLPGQCYRCRSFRSLQLSTAEFPALFCSQQCEHAFIQAAVADLSLDDCIRIHKRLDDLLGVVESRVMESIGG